MTLTILYLNKCRRERLRDAFGHVILTLGPQQASHIVDALQRAYQPHNSTRVNYNYSMHALQFVVGLEGLAAISLIKEAWNEGSLTPRLEGAGREERPTHPSTHTIQ